IVSALTATGAEMNRVEADFSLGGVASGPANIYLQTADGRRDTLYNAFLITPPDGWSFDSALGVSTAASYTGFSGGRCAAVTDIGNVDAVWLDERGGTQQVYTIEAVGGVFGAALPLTSASGSAYY